MLNKLKPVLILLLTTVLVFQVAVADINSGFGGSYGTSQLYEDESADLGVSGTMSVENTLSFDDGVVMSSSGSLDIGNGELKKHFSAEDTSGRGCRAAYYAYASDSDNYDWDQVLNKASRTYVKVGESLDITNAKGLVVGGFCYNGAGDYAAVQIYGSEEEGVDLDYSNTLYATTSYAKAIQDASSSSGSLAFDVWAERGNKDSELQDETAYEDGSREFGPQGEDPYDQFARSFMTFDSTNSIRSYHGEAKSTSYSAYAIGNLYSTANADFYSDAIAGRDIDTDDFQLLNRKAEGEVTVVDGETIKCYVKAEDKASYSKITQSVDVSDADSIQRTLTSTYMVWPTLDASFATSTLDIQSMDGNDADLSAKEYITTKVDNVQVKERITKANGGNITRTAQADTYYSGVAEPGVLDETLTTETYFDVYAKQQLTEGDDLSSFTGSATISATSRIALISGSFKASVEDGGSIRRWLDSKNLDSTMDESLYYLKHGSLKIKERGTSSTNTVEAT